MKKINLEIEIPDGIDVEHMQQSVTDATLISDDVTPLEHDFIVRLSIEIIKQVNKL